MPGRVRRSGAACLALLAAVLCLQATASVPSGGTVAAAAPTCGSWLDTPEWSTHGMVAATNQHGLSFVAWKAASAAADDPIEAAHGRFVSRSGRLGPVIDLSPEQPVAGPASVAIDAQGNVLVALAVQAPPVDYWRVWVRRISASGRLGPLHQLSEDQRDYFPPQVALTPRGRGLVAVPVPHLDELTAHVDLWDVGRSEAPRRIRQVQLSDFDHSVLVGAGGSESLYSLISGVGDPAAEVTGYVVRKGRARRVDVTRGIDAPVATAALGVDPKGRAHLLLDTGFTGRAPRMLARSWEGHALTRPTLVGRFSTDLMRGSFAVDATGAGPAYWSSGVDRSTYRLHLGHVTPRGRLTRVKDLGSPHTYDVGGTTLELPVPPAVGVSSRGDGLVAWKPQYDEADPSSETVLVRSIGPDGRLGSKVHTMGLTHDMLVLAPDGGRPVLARTVDLGAGLTQVCLERRRW